MVSKNGPRYPMASDSTHAVVEPIQGYEIGIFHVPHSDGVHGQDGGTRRGTKVDDVQRDACNGTTVPTDRGDTMKNVRKWGMAWGSVAIGFCIVGATADSTVEQCVETMEEPDLEEIGGPGFQGYCLDSKDGYRELREHMVDRLVSLVDDCSATYGDDSPDVGTCVVCSLHVQDDVSIECGYCAMVYAACVEQTCASECQADAGADVKACIVPCAKASQCESWSDTCAGVGTPTVDACMESYQPVDWEQLHNTHTLCENDREHYRAWRADLGVNIASPVMLCMLLYDHHSAEFERCMACRVADEADISPVCASCTARYTQCMMDNCAETLDCAAEDLPNALSDTCLACADRKGCTDLLDRCDPDTDRDDHVGDNGTTTDPKGGGCQASRPHPAGWFLPLFVAMLLLVKTKTQRNQHPAD